MVDFYDAVHRLIAFGYEIGRPAAGQSVLDAISDAVRRYQSDHGLVADGAIGPETAEHLALPRCGCPDVEHVAEHASRPAAWPPLVDGRRLVRYWLDDLPQRLSPQQWRDVFETACNSWSAVCGLHFERVGVRTEADLLVFSGREDGPSNTLAWCELPVGMPPRRQLKMKLDAAEAWSFDFAVGVVAHELGHGIGLSHIPPAKGVALLNPIFNRRVLKPQPLDVAEAQLRYGPPKAPPTPVPAPTPTPSLLPAKGVVLIVDGVEVYRSAA
ncbi:MAG: matrixin family metalloprotease [Planctomycetia bacterium]